MVRQTLFKAKDKDDGKWYEGYYMCLHDTTYCCMPSDDLTKAKKMEKENTHHYIVFELMTDWGLPNRHLRAEILPETLCQYTGLTDKNGKKIWENDIIRCGRNIVVSWDEHFASWCLTRKGWLYKHFFGESQNPEDCEVVGNIFDNLDLLEEKHE